jgi:hypothetical protein
MGVDEGEVLDEAARRRKRTLGYLKLWGIDVDLTALAVPVVEHGLPNTASVIGRAKALCLVALKGQGLSQHEAFAFADAYGVWDHLSLEENDFVLTPDPSHADLVQYAWRFEGLGVLVWALGLANHLGFPAESADPGKAVERFVVGVLAPETDRSGAPPVTRRSDKELLDAADVAFALEAICRSVRVDQPAPAQLHRGVVHERAEVFRWLIRA